MAYEHSAHQGSPSPGNGWWPAMTDRRVPPQRTPARQSPDGARVATADPIGAALSRAYAKTLAEPLPPSLADLLRSLE